MRLHRSFIGGDFFSLHASRQTINVSRHSTLKLVQSCSGMERSNAERNSIVCVCSGHFQEKCLYYGIIVFVEPPNSSDQLQILDIGLFGIQRRAMQKVYPKKDLKEQTQQITKIINAWKISSMPSNIISVFEHYLYKHSKTQLDFQNMRAVIKCI